MEHKRSAAIAAVLSFIYPGLGHAYLGLRRQALVFAIPALVVTVAIILVVLTEDVDSTLGYLITPSGSMTALVLIALTGGWRILAMVDAVLAARRRSGIGPLAILAAVAVLTMTVVPHAVGSVFAYSIYDASSRIFVAAGPDDPPEASQSTVDASAPGASGPTPMPTDDYQATPLATPESEQARINILLTGVDSAETRTTSLTDTMLVVSVNPTDGTAVMISLPRDIANFQLYDGRTFTGKINSLMTWARNHPTEFPDGPFPTLMNEIGYLIGVPIHYYAALDLQGFRRMVDEVGGVTVDNPRAIDDPKYEWLDGTWGFTLPAGTVRLDGRSALAYARSRQGLGDSDFSRARRQQQLLVALRNKLSKPEMLTNLPNIINVAGDTIRTNIPASRLDVLIKLGRKIKGADIDRYVLGPPYASHPPNSETGGYYTLKLDMSRMAKLSRKLFGDDSRYAK
jgi:polyisoprenyl-teichoic acid--peptidoglycan teichoic acid transferase